MFLLDAQRASIVDPSNGKTKRRVNGLSGMIKNAVAYSVSDSGSFVVAIIESTGDLVVWIKDTEKMLSIRGRSEFSLRLGSHAPYISMSEDFRRVVLVTSRNNVFVWEAAEPDLFTFDSNNISSKNEASPTLNGNWSHVVASQQIKTLEDSKELALHVRFVQDEVIYMRD
jgi:hypothetical protein